MCVKSFRISWLCSSALRAKFLGLEDLLLVGRIDDGASGLSGLSSSDLRVEPDKGRVL